MKVNFDITQNNALTIEGRHIDLHNNFDFVGFDYKVADREIKLHWKKSSGDWVDKNEFSSLVLTHSEVTFLNVINQDEKSTYEDDSCLGEITFFPSTAREINDSIIPQSKPNDSDDIIYMFENGQRIRIHCELVELKTNQGQVMYLNSGDWVENLTALEYKKAKWKIFYYKKADFVLQEIKEDIVINGIDITNRHSSRSIEYIWRKCSRKCKNKDDSIDFSR